MAKLVDYRGYTITSIPMQPVGTHEWTPDIKISTERAGVVAMQSYTDGTTHIMEEDADLHGIRMGRQIIDGEIPASGVGAPGFAEPLAGELPLCGEKKKGSMWI